MTNDVHIIADLKAVKVDGDPAVLTITIIAPLTEHNQADLMNLSNMKRTRAPIVVNITCTQQNLPEERGTPT